VTANDLYLPIGRTANFTLRTKDVLHSFWIPQLGGKRDLISNHTNYLWFTPDTSLRTSVFNGSCNEYCGASHANMRFRTFVVTPTEFDGWVQHQLSPRLRRGSARAARAGARRYDARGWCQCATSVRDSGARAGYAGGRRRAAANRLHVPHAVSAGLRDTRHTDSGGLLVPRQHHR
jgi:hypothetical protein